jgi:SulP family sulfate permease
VVSEQMKNRAVATLPLLAAGLVVGLMTIISTLALAGLIFAGPLAPGLLAGISALLVAAAVGCALFALTSRYPGLIAAPSPSTAPVYALIAAAFEPQLAGIADPMLRAQAIVIVCGLATIFTGLAFALIGLLRAGSLAKFLPYPVVCGYNAGLGWMFVLGGLALTLNVPLAGLDLHQFTRQAAIAPAASCVALAALIVVLDRRLRHWAVIPALLAIACALFHVARASLGVDLPTATDTGWLLGPFAPGRIFSPPSLQAFAVMPWGQLPTLLPLLLTLVLIAATSAIMLISGLELELHRSLDFDREMLAAGGVNVVAGLTGGVAATPSLLSTALARRMGGTGRAVGLVVALCVAAPLLFGTGVVNEVPRFVAGGLLLSNGIERLFDRVWLERRRLPWHEWGVIVAVLLAVAFIGFVDGVLLGLAITLVIFVVNYRRIPVIRETLSAAGFRSSMVRGPESEVVLARDGGTIQLWRLQGYLFFLNASSLLRIERPSGLRFLVLDFAGVSGIDSSAGQVMRRLQQITAETGCALLMTNLSPAVRAGLSRQGIRTAQPAALERFVTTDEALQHAEAAVLATAGIIESDVARVLAREIATTIGSEIDPGRLTPYVDRLSLAQNEVLMHQGEVADAMYFIVQGTVAAYLERPGKRPVRIRTAGAGTLVGEIGIYTGQRRTATVRAEAVCVAQRLSLSSIRRMEQADSDLATLLHRFLATVLAIKLTGATLLIEHLSD